MIVLDTNVVSEAMKPSANPAVLAWLNKQVAETLFLSSVTLAELLYGIGSLPDGRRKEALAARDCTRPDLKASALDVALSRLWI